jgi:hypothetical protein
LIVTLKPCPLIFKIWFNNKKKKTNLDLLEIVENIGWAYKKNTWKFIREREDVRGFERGKILRYINTECYSISGSYDTVVVKFKKWWWKLVEISFEYKVS